MRARALELIALTACRVGELVGMTFVEIDLEKRVWVVPADRMKNSEEHRKPLPDRAIEILSPLVAKGVRKTDLVFTREDGRPLNDEILRREHLKLHDSTPHGLRASLKTWTSDATNFPREIAEAQLAHSIGNAVEQSYQRSDLLERRRELIEAWSRYCSEPPREDANVVPMRARHVS
jgi:integrase